MSEKEVETDSSRGKKDEQTPSPSSKSPRVSVVIRNRLGLGSPVFVRWPERKPPETQELADGATLVTDCSQGEALSLSAEIEALATPFGEEFGSGNPYGDPGGFSDDPYGYGGGPFGSAAGEEEEEEPQYELLTLRAAFRQRSQTPMTLTCALEDVPPQPVKLVLHAIPTAKVREGNEHLRAALLGMQKDRNERKGRPHAATTPHAAAANAEAESSREEADTAAFSSFSIFDAPLQAKGGKLPLLEPLTRLVKAAEAGHHDARAALVLVQLTSWGEDAQVHAQAFALKQDMTSRALAADAKRATEEVSNAKKERAEAAAAAAVATAAAVAAAGHPGDELPLVEVEASATEEHAKAEAVASAAVAAAGEAAEASRQAKASALALGRLLHFNPQRAQRALEHAAHGGGGAAGAGGGGNPPSGRMGPGGKTNTEAAAAAAAVAAMAPPSPLAQLALAYMFHRGVGVAAPMMVHRPAEKGGSGGVVLQRRHDNNGAWRSPTVAKQHCEAAVSFYLAIADRSHQQMQQQQQMQQMQQMPHVQSADPAAAGPHSSRYSFYDDVTYTDAARLSQRWLRYGSAWGGAYNMYGGGAAGGGGGGGHSAHSLYTVGGMVGAEAGGGGWGGEGGNTVENGFGPMQVLKKKMQKRGMSCHKLVIVLLCRIASFEGLPPQKVLP
jgi:hypothetical protein